MKTSQDHIIYTLQNSNGFLVKISNYGGRLLQFFVKDKSGKSQNIILGYKNEDDYFSDEYYMGAIIGRYANRIDNGKFTLKEEEIQLTDTNELKVDFYGETDQSTPVNLSFHPYFNLSNAQNESISKHFLQINAKKYTPIDEISIPTGEIQSVENSPFDFRESKNIGNQLLQNHTQLEIGNGSDHNFVLYKKNKIAARLLAKDTGIQLDVSTNQKGLQIYTGNYLTEKPFYPKAGICLEPQAFPNSVNTPHFPNTILHPSEKYHWSSIYKISLI